ncbi:MAG: Holliday junction resolvase RuvX [Patescibacteria group bacterium]
MKKFLGLDIGEKRIGVALAENSLVSAYGTLDNSNYQTAVLEIAKICHAEQITKIIVGIPKNDDTFEMDKIRSFAMELAKNIHLPIVYIDETLTSKEAERLLKNTKLNPRSKKYKEEIDKISAKLILEQYAGKHQK